MRVCFGQIHSAFFSMEMDSRKITFVYHAEAGEQFLKGGSNAPQFQPPKSMIDVDVCIFGNVLPFP